MPLLFEIGLFDAILTVPQPLVYALEVQINTVGKRLDQSFRPLFRVRLSKKFVHLCKLFLRLALQFKTFARLSLLFLLRLSLRSALSTLDFRLLLIQRLWL